MDMKKILAAIDGASAPRNTAADNDMRRFVSIIRDESARSSQSMQVESVTLQPRKSITSPVLNADKDARPSMIGKYFKSVEKEFDESDQRFKDRSSRLAEMVSKKVMERVALGQETPSGINRLTGKPIEPAAATPEPGSTAPMPGKDLPKAERADRRAGTVTFNGQDYKMVMLEPEGLRPRGGQRVSIPQAVMGERGIGNYIGVLAGNTVYVLPLGQKESIREETEGVDSVTLDIPLFIRLLEFAREDAEDDMTLHQIAEKMIGMKEEGQSLSMSDYEDIVGSVNEAHGNSKIYDKCWTGYKKVPGKKSGEDGSCVKK